MPPDSLSRRHQRSIAAAVTLLVAGLAGQPARAQQPPVTPQQPATAQPSQAATPASQATQQPSQATQQPSQTTQQPSQATPPADAADAADATLPEVVVSAERVSSLARTTPVSIGVVSRREIEAKGVMDLHDLVGVIAGVSVPNGFSNQPQAVAIRGVGASLPAMSQAVGIYLDDVPLIRGYATGVWDLPDIVQIEVLRGPQGTLYGQNSSAGAVKIVSRDPDAAREAWLAVSAGNLGALETRGYLNGPVDAGSLTGSLAFSRRTNDGTGTNPTLQRDVNKLDVTQLRGKLRWDGGAGREAVLAVDAAQDRSDANTSNAALNTPHAAPRVSFNGGNAGTFKRNAGGASLKVTLPLESGVTLRSITALRAYRDDPTMVDFGGLDVQRFAISQNVAQQAFSQEVQLQGKVDALAWTTGVMLVRDRFDFNRYTTSAPLAAPAPVYTEANTHLDTTDIGAYGQARWAFDASSGLTFGLRAYHTRQTGANQFWRTTASRQRTAQVYNAADLASSESGLLPKLGADVKLSAATFAYASIARGEKFGGFNRAAESLVSAQVASRPEKVTTYELGLKQAAPGGVFSANLAVFYNDYRDYLASLSNTRVNGVQVNDVVLINAGKARTYGADLELAAKLAEHTRWTLTMEVLRSRFTEFANPTGAAATNYVGNELPNAPRLTLGTTIDHTMVLADGASVAFDLSAQYLRHSFNDVANTVALAMPNQVYLNASATWRPVQSHWSFQLRGKNLGDKAYILQRTTIPALGVDSAYYNPPRAIQLSARYTF